MSSKWFDYCQSQLLNCCDANAIVDREMFDFYASQLGLSKMSSQFYLEKPDRPMVKISSTEYNLGECLAEGTIIASGKPYRFLAIQDSEFSAWKFAYNEMTRSGLPHPYHRWALQDTVEQLTRERIGHGSKT